MSSLDYKQEKGTVTSLGTDLSYSKLRTDEMKYNFTFDMKRTKNSHRSRISKSSDTMNSRRRKTNTYCRAFFFNVSK